jgi:hypothetical protein
MTLSDVLASHVLAYTFLHLFESSLLRRARTEKLSMNILKAEPAGATDNDFVAFLVPFQD